MATVEQICQFLDELAPPELAEDWDNVGLLIGRKPREIHKLMTCLTLTTDVAKEAITQGVNIVITHHPVLFRGTKQISDETSEGEMLLMLIENGVAVYSPHTRFDSSITGINQQLAESFGLQEIRPLRAHDEMEQSGSGRMGSRADSLTLQQFLSVVKHATGAEYVEFVGDRAAPVKSVGVACGAAIEFLTDAISLGCDTFVTGEARFHAALEARSSGINLVLLGHYSSERTGVETLAQMIAAKFPEIDCFPSRNECDPLHLA